MSIYDFTVKDVKGQDVPMETYKGKVLLIVNTATKCGLTPQFEGLESTYQNFKGQPFEVLSFPSNQFLREQKSKDVENEHTAGLKEVLKNLNQEFPGNSIQWNFTKFLVNKDGSVVKRYSPTVSPEEIESDIEELVNKE